MNFSRQQKLIIFLALSLVVLILFVRLVILPLVNKVRDASQEYLAGQASLVELSYKESLLKELEKDYQEKQADLAKIEGVFLGSNEAVGFISDLEKIAQQTGNIFEIKTAGTSESAEAGQSFLTLRISLWGNFNNLLSFLASLEDSPYPPYRLVEIDSLNIRRIGETGPSGLNPALTSLLSEGDLETIIGLKIYTRD